jgi:hypothetical protein
MPFVWAAEPMRLTDKPTLIAGRIPSLKSFVSKKIWPSVNKDRIVYQPKPPPKPCKIITYHKAFVNKIKLNIPIRIEIIVCKSPILNA